MKNTLTFSKRNSKMNATAAHMGLKKTEFVAFDLPAGWSCPAADLCHSRADKETGIRTDFGVFVCYATKAESLYPAVRDSRWSNFELVKGKSADEIAALIEASLPKTVKFIRIHSSGDFFNRAYFEGWKKFATNHPEIVIFGYTKLLPFVKADKPDNFTLIYSYGSKMDKVWNNSIQTCFVVTKGGDWDISADGMYATNKTLNVTIPLVCGKEKGHEWDDFYLITGLNRTEKVSFGILFH